MGTWVKVGKVTIVALQRSPVVGSDFVLYSSFSPASHPVRYLYGAIESLFIQGNQPLAGNDQFEVS
jgi:hypothetical protein